MNEQIERWRMKAPGKVGGFGEYSVQGFQFDSLAGERAWWITAWGANDPITICWVSKGKFYRVMLRFNGRHDSHIQTYGEITDITEGKRKAILEAIATWEKQGISA